MTFLIERIRGQLNTVVKQQITLLTRDPRQALIYIKYKHFWQRRSVFYMQYLLAAWQSISNRHTGTLFTSFLAQCSFPSGSWIRPFALLAVLLFRVAFVVTSGEGCAIIIWFSSNSWRFDNSCPCIYYCFVLLCTKCYLNCNQGHAYSYLYVLLLHWEWWVLKYLSFSLLSRTLEYWMLFFPPYLIQKGPLKLSKDKIQMGYNGTAEVCNLLSQSSAAARLGQMFFYCLGECVTANQALR
jgi:hypothetical protein